MFLFRADGNATIGTGHVMRCLSIADAARDYGIESIFVTAGDDFSSIIEGRGFRGVVLGTDYRDMDGELAHMKRVIREEHPTTIFVDSYFVTKRYLEELRLSSRCNLVYIDDVLSFAYPCDILINDCVCVDEAAYSRLYHDIDMPELLLGPTYVPLREEFKLTVSNDGRSFETSGKSIFVSTGGADVEHLMIELIRVVKSMPATVGYIFHFVVGGANEDKEIIISEASGVESIRLHENVTKMADLMRSCDVAISAAGSTLYELCATQLPTITYILVDNQMTGAYGFEKRGIMKCAGDIRDIGASELASRLIKMAVELCSNEDECRAMVERQRSVVDGRGAERIVRAVGDVC